MNAEGWAELVHGTTRPVAQVAIEDDLRRAVLLGTDVAPGVTVGCSITELHKAVYRTSVFSDDLALALDVAQYESGTGPCIAAARDQQRHQLDDLGSVDQFAAFAAEALANGVHSSLSLPLSGAHRPSALNIYATAPGAFADVRARSVAHLLARAIAARIGPAGPAPSPSLAQERKIARAHAHAALIKGAQQALVGTHGSQEQAFDWLTRQSLAQRRSIFAVAQDAIHDSDAAS